MKRLRIVEVYLYSLSLVLQTVMKTGVTETVLALARFKQDQLLKKTDGRKKSRISGITKLDDANNAGTRHASRCTLIVTEGDSAKALAVSGLAVVGRDDFGVFPLRGKLLNVRDASSKQIRENQEISNIKQILGLQQGKTYENTESLRYGHLMIMTDQVNTLCANTRVVAVTNPETWFGDAAAAALLWFCKREN